MLNISNSVQREILEEEVLRKMLKEVLNDFLEIRKNHLEEVIEKELLIRRIELIEE